MRAPLTALLLLTVAGLYGCPSCPYEEACDGDTLLTCSLGVDQLVGDPEELEIPCEAPNPTCVTVDERNALCAIDEGRTCAPSSAPRCEGDTLISCKTGFEFAEDCAAAGNVCGEVDGEARCYLEPLTACDVDFSPYCDGDLRGSCVVGYVELEDCAARGDGWTCGESRTPGNPYCGPP